MDNWRRTRQEFHVGLWFASESIGDEMTSPKVRLDYQLRLRRWLVSLAIVVGLGASSGQSFAEERLLSFTNDVVPVLTKAGCNAGSCHAKAGGGQKGFQLSLLGFEVADDYEHLVKDVRGRRFSVAAPDKSLLLLKGSGQIPHGGGVRLKKDSAAYATLRDWIAQGTPFGPPGEPTLVSFQVLPERVSLKPLAEQQLQVQATYSDGTVRDVTQLALYESNDKAMADVTPEGLVKVSDISGKVAVMVRFQGRVSVFCAAIPLGAPVEGLPPAKNFIDEFVFTNLKELGIPPSPLCDDATYLRRVTLDICGRLPTDAEAQVFLASTAADKRDLALEKHEFGNSSRKARVLP